MTARVKDRDFPIGMLVRELLAAVMIVWLFAGRPATVSDGAWMMANAVVLAAMLALGLVIHECGHAFAARKLGLEVFEIHIGVGKNRMRSRLGDVEIWWNALPFSGQVLAGARTATMARLRWWLTIAAGPAANLVVGTAAVALELALGGAFDVGHGGVRPLMLFGIANVVLAMINLTPLVGSDGTALLVIPFRREVGTELVALSFIMRAARARRRGEVEAARAELEAGLIAMPHDVTLRNALALGRVDAGEVAEARTELRALLAAERAAGRSAPLVENDLAWVNVVIGDEDGLTEAEALSRSALDKLRKLPAAHGTRGAVMVARGEIEPGLAYLRRALALNSEPRSRGCNAAWIAIGEARRGRGVAAREHLALARSLDPRNEVMARAEAAVAALDLVAA